MHWYPTPSGASKGSTGGSAVSNVQDPIIAQGYTAMAECGGYDAACPVSMTDDPEADPEAAPMSSNVISTLEGARWAASRCGHLPARICSSGRIRCICVLDSRYKLVFVAHLLSSPWHVHFSTTVHVTIENRHDTFTHPGAENLPSEHLYSCVLLLCRSGVS